MNHQLGLFTGQVENTINAVKGLLEEGKNGLFFSRDFLNNHFFTAFVVRLFGVQTQIQKKCLTTG